MGSFCDLLFRLKIDTSKLIWKEYSDKDKEKRKSESLIDAEWHEYVRNLHYGKNILKFSQKGGFQKSVQKKTKLDQNTNDFPYLNSSELSYQDL